MRMLIAASLMGVVASCAARSDPPPREAAPPPADHAAPSASPAAQPEVGPPGDATGTGQPATTAKVIVDEKGCVRDPLAHATQLILDKHATPVADRLGRAPQAADFTPNNGCFSAGPLSDVDGDGVEETVVSEECSWGTHASLKLLYLSNGSCQRFAGDLVSGELSPMSTAGAGVRDLEATVSNGCAGEEFTWTHYRWDGKAYGAIDSATCFFCTDRLSSRPPRANSHPYCKAEAKSRTTP